MAFEPGRKKTGGRKKGVRNHLTMTVKESVLKAFDEVGGVEYLRQVALDDPKTFCALLSKIIPAEVSADVGGDLIIRWATGSQSD